MRDVAAAERKKIDPTLMQRLRLKPAKIKTLAQGIRAIANMEEPLRKVCLAPGLCLTGPHIICRFAHDFKHARQLMAAIGCGASCKHV